MTNFVITIKLEDLDESDTEARKSADSFCQCVFNLVGLSEPLIRYHGADYVVAFQDGWVTTAFVNIPDDKFQSIEEIIGHTLWDIRTIP